MEQKQWTRAFRATRLIFFLCGITIASWAPMVPFAKSRLDINDAELGLILLVFGIGALFTMPLTGWLIHRFGVRNIIVVSGLIMMGILPLLAFTASPILLSIFLFLFGASNGAMNVSMNSHAVAVEQTSSRPVMSGLHCFFSLGGLVGAGFLSFLLEADYDLFFSVSYIAIALMFTLITQFTSLLSPEDKGKEKTEFSFPRGKVWLLASLCFMAFLAEGAMLDWSCLFLISTHGYQVSNAGLGYAAFAVAMAFGRFVGDRLTKRFGPVNILQFGSLLAASGLVLSVFGSHLALGGFVLIGLGASNIVPVLFSAAGRLPGISPSLALTVVTTLGYTGILLGPALIGFAAQATSLSFAFICIALLLTAVTLNARIVEQEVCLGSRIDS